MNRQLTFKTLFSLLLVTILLGSCATTENIVVVAATETVPETKVEQVKKTTEVNRPPANQQTIDGTYKSTVGVQTKLSCYCGNGGTLTTPEGKEILVCFESEKNKVENCENMTVVGSFVLRKLESELGNPCPTGSMTFLNVTSYTCE